MSSSLDGENEMWGGHRFEWERRWKEEKIHRSCAEKEYRRRTLVEHLRNMRLRERFLDMTSPWVFPQDPSPATPKLFSSTIRATNSPPQPQSVCTRGDYALQGHGRLSNSPIEPSASACIWESLWWYNTLLSRILASHREFCTHTAGRRERRS